MLVVFFLLGQTVLGADTPAVSTASGQKTNCRTAVQQAMKQSFKYDPAIRQKAEADGLLDDDVVRLEPLLVNEAKVSPYVVRHLAHQSELFEAAKPSLANGAKIPGLNRVDIGLIPYNDIIPSRGNPPSGWTLISMPW